MIEAVVYLALKRLRWRIRSYVCPLQKSRKEAAYASLDTQQISGPIRARGGESEATGQGKSNSLLLLYLCKVNWDLESS